MENIMQVLKSRERKKQLLKNAKCFILDLDGTFYIENNIIDGSLDFLNFLDKNNIDFKFFTNNSSKDSQFYIKRIHNMGYPVKEDRMMTSNQVIIEYLIKNAPNKKVYVVGTEYLINDMARAGINLVKENADIVVVGFDTTLIYKKLLKACHFIRNGADFLAVNPDYNCPVENGFIPDCGSICALITASTGIKPKYFGKPYVYTLKYILKKTRLKEEQIVFVGDRLYTDIAIGKNNDSVTILVLTGETKEKDLYNSNIKPKLIFNSLKDIKELLEDIY